MTGLQRTVAISISGGVLSVLAAYLVARYAIQIRVQLGHGFLAVLATVAIGMASTAGLAFKFR